MAAKVFCLLVVVLIVFQTEAFTYRREYYDPESPFMKLMEDVPGPEEFISRRGLQCVDEEPKIFAPLPKNSARRPVAIVRTTHDCEPLT
ncbi:hypothetical protein ACROYT_G002296 [Oculina patagonica]